MYKLLFLKIIYPSLFKNYNSNSNSYISFQILIEHLQRFNTRVPTSSSFFVSKFLRISLSLKIRLIRHSERIAFDSRVDGDSTLRQG